MKTLLAQLMECPEIGQRALDAALLKVMKPEAEVDENDELYDAPGAMQRHEIPYYTSSVDAALELVPEGWLWQASKHDTNDTIRMPPYIVMLIKLTDNPMPEYIPGMAPTLALAFCIAAMKARGLG